MDFVRLKILGNKQIRNILGSSQKVTYVLSCSFGTDFNLNFGLMNVTHAIIPYFTVFCTKNKPSSYFLAKYSFSAFFLNRNIYIIIFLMKKLHLWEKVKHIQ